MNRPTVRHGYRFTYGSIEYVVKASNAIGNKLLRDALINSNREPRVYLANRIGKSGVVTQKTDVFFRWVSGGMSKIID
jgi:hypothetical protein